MAPRRRPRRRGSSSSTRGRRWGSRRTTHPATSRPSASSEAHHVDVRVTMHVSSFSYNNSANPSRTGRRPVGWAVGIAASPSEFEPCSDARSTGDDDVAIKVLYCGICHSDLHTIKNDWKNAIYPVVPGHEIAGVVTEVGKNVAGFAAGDRVGVGCMVNACRACESCEEGAENYCARVVLTYNSRDRDGAVTRGGYSDMVVADARFVVRFPDALPLDAAAPLLCAGATVYAPMRRHALGAPGSHVGVIGLGGLGHVAVSSPGRSGREPHGKMILLGIPDKPLQVSAFALIGGGKTLAGSCMASISETQEMLDFAAEHGVAADVEVIGAGEVNAAMERLAKGDVRYRFVIDVGNTLKAD
uniref:cinnamyl-alcohol dehydrogenase n=1 Tax=Aegilops tauschii TaxID=37682 RepID=M8BJN2_AEGTA